MATHSAEPDDNPLRCAPVPRARNKMLAVALVSVVACLFVIVVGLVVAFHYVETHHMLTPL